MGLRMKNLNIIGVHWKIQFLTVEIHEKPIYRGELPKKVGLGQFSDLSGGLAKKSTVGVFQGRGVDRGW